ncbi:MAG: hypothetical protein JO079_01195, partial [Frankiaceae bacterium]|nr:hypothetical protein [Frankiaceae bacterium]
MTDPGDFAGRILGILTERFGRDAAEALLADSPLIGYLVTKTRAANRGSKSRGSFANLYAIYVLVEDYIRKGFDRNGGYDRYEGAKFSDLFARQRELPFGEKLQNHALNSRLNDEFHRYYRDVDTRPIIRDMSTQRYWFSEALLMLDDLNIASAVLEIIDAYIDARRDNFSKFIEDCRGIQSLEKSAREERRSFVADLLSPTTDARIFEIVSFAIMKAHYATKSVWIGWSRERVEEQALILYKTGRTNANDGGI